MTSDATSSLNPGKLVSLRPILPVLHDARVLAPVEPVAARADTWTVARPTPRPRAPPPPSNVSATATYDRPTYPPSATIAVPTSAYTKISPPTYPRGAPIFPPPNLSTPAMASNYNRPAYSTATCFAPRYSPARQPRPLDSAGRPLAFAMAPPRASEAFDSHSRGLERLKEDIARGVFHPRLEPSLPSAVVSLDGSPQTDSRHRDLADFETGRVLETFSSPTSSETESGNDSPARPPAARQVVVQLRKPELFVKALAKTAPETAERIAAAADSSYSLESAYRASRDDQRDLLLMVIGIPPRARFAPGPAATRAVRPFAAPPRSCSIDPWRRVLMLITTEERLGAQGGARS
ncbi:hypothetical protein JL722_2107 [Aureococcus anophagefferens]|nr:hypothetical protein JL722_2107 [Aureococcus anophagefferens]